MQHPGWRHALRRELTWLVALKAAALILLWWLFFSPAHHRPVDGAATSRQLGLAPGGAPPAAHPAAEQSGD